MKTTLRARENNMEKLKIEDLKYRGRPVTSLTREELLKVVLYCYEKAARDNEILFSPLNPTETYRARARTLLENSRIEKEIL
jgi:hypothetical protein